MPGLSDIFIKQHTIKWIREFVIKYNICPFAKHVIDKETLTIQISTTNTLQAAAAAVFKAISLLDEESKIETILLIFPNFLHDFFDYLDFVDWVENLMQQQNYEGVYQLATFHPHYCFAGAENEDVSNYTNRSPYPMLHLLREAQVESAIAYYGDTTQIPEDNITTLQKIGLEKVKNLLLALAHEDQ